jgi:hypothetical protein
MIPINTPELLWLFVWLHQAGVPRVGEINHAFIADPKVIRAVKIFIRWLVL